MQGISSDNSKARQIELILEKVDSLPTLSPVATRLMQISTVQDADLDPIIELIESDLTLTGRVLGLCRRADKGLGDRITTVRRAVVMLGLESIQSIVLGVSVYDLMGSASGAALETDRAIAGPETPSTAKPGYPTGFQRNEFWKHSVAVAAGASLIAQAHPMSGVAPSEAFVAGLMHDLGKLVLDLLLPRSYARVVQLAERRGCGSSQIERELFGLDHHTAAKRLGEHWGLPHALLDVMWLHSQPAESVPDLPHKSLLGIVNASRSLARTLMLGWSGDFNNPPALEGRGGLCEPFGLSAAHVKSIVPRLHDEVAYRCAVLGLDKPTSADLMLDSIGSANRRLSRLNALLQQRSRGADEQARSLQAITSFHANWRPGRSVIETLGDVVRSARDFLGEGYFAIVFQSRSGEPWQLHTFFSDGSPDRMESIDAPGERDATGHGSVADLSSLIVSDHAAVRGLALLPWLTEHIEGGVDVRTLQLVPLLTTEERRGPVAVLLHDHPDSAPRRQGLGSLASSWAASIAAALQHEGARRLGERLAAANRTLVETRQALAQAQSMARLGEMAAGAAHEMNNPLTVISGRSQILADRLGDPADQAAARSIVAASQQLTDLITSLRLISDPPSPSCEPLTVESLINDAVARAEARTSTFGRVTFQPATASITTDRELASSALAEVIANALEATPDTPVEIQAHIEPVDGRLMVLVKDHGPGMSARALHHAFDPFFSEKPAGRQTGLGLTRARRLIELLAGDITLQSMPGVGTTAIVAIGSVEHTTRAVAA